MKACNLLVLGQGVKIVSDFAFTIFKIQGTKALHRFVTKTT